MTASVTRRQLTPNDRDCNSWQLLLNYNESTMLPMLDQNNKIHYNIAYLLSESLHNLIAQLNAQCGAPIYRPC